jgi:predicted nucleic acid-binding OB-fold protein
MEGVHTLNTMKGVCVMDLKRVIDKYRKEFKSAESVKNTNSISIVTNKNMVEKLIRDLNSYAYIASIPLEPIE